MGSCTQVCSVSQHVVVGRSTRRKSLRSCGAPRPRSVMTALVLPRAKLRVNPRSWNRAWTCAKRRWIAGSNAAGLSVAHGMARSSDHIISIGSRLQRARRAVNSGSCAIHSSSDLPTSVMMTWKTASAIGEPGLVPLWVRFSSSGSCCSLYQVSLWRSAKRRISLGAAPREL